MSVLDWFGKDLPKALEANARRHANSRSIRIRHASAGRVVADVSAADRGHRASVYIGRGNIGWNCDCPAYSRDRRCVHVAALALFGCDQGYLPEHPASHETRPRGRSGSPKWLSATGELRRADVDEPRPVIHHEPSAPKWQKLIDKVRQEDSDSAAAPEDWPADRQILYLIDLAATSEAGALIVRLAVRDRRSSGEWSKPKTRGINFPNIEALPDVADQQILALLSAPEGIYRVYDPVYEVPDRLHKTVAQLMCRTGRSFLREQSGDELKTLRWDEGPAWQLWLEARREESTQLYLFMGSLRRNDVRMPISRPTLALGGVAIFSDCAAELDDGGAGAWIPILRQQGVVRVPIAQADQLLSELLSLSSIPRLDFPDELKIQTVNVEPRPRLHIRSPHGNPMRPDHLLAGLSFDYDGFVAPYSRPQRMAFDKDRRRLIVRNQPRESSAMERLRELGARPELASAGGDADVHFHQRRLPHLVRDLVQEGWTVEADGRVYRRGGALHLHVASGIDWFELKGDVDFEGHTAKLPDVLAAIRKGEAMVQLDDGTFGLLPEEWLRRFGLVATFGEQEEDAIRFGKAQVGLLDALLATQPEATCDETFERARGMLASFEGIRPIPQPPTFVGELRPYQRDGLGWFDFLEQFGFGGCLADDMGLGKTIQVLALLESRRARSASRTEMSGGVPRDGGPQCEPRAPSLIVVPKSLVFNWHQEAQRFTPALRLLDHTGIDRIRGTEHLSDYDVIITTYGTLRRDVEFLKDAEFDYVILDEAQAIKNPASESAKALRLIKGRHGLALSGTPVQNHLGDLWSLFDFLNPGMLGSAGVFNNGNSSLRNPDRATRELLSRVLRPFILRRTKEQVAADLPPKLEQTIFCELENGQRKLYDELREYYRSALLSRVDRLGLNKSKMQILEALLRLRQAALHPGLLDEQRRSESSAKLDVLLPQLDEVMEEGHKALVFSQFTSMLAIVRQRLDEQKIVYEYLDGQTKDRQSRVERFQNDSKCRLFLVSLKAGGLGLNLTAADYVFLLDPWWNPAVEQQAIDRTHRIGQTKQVYACRLIAKDTVEEKVLALQRTKRDLADAIITADNSVIRDLGREDLELLLS